MFTGQTRSFDGAVVVITGGAGDIGRALASRFVTAGSRVVLLDLDTERLRVAVDALESGGAEVLGIQCDLTDPAACELAFEQVQKLRGGVDVLINNAGLSHRSRLCETDVGVLRKVIEVNLFGSIHCTQAALPSLRERGGCIIAISSVAGFAPLLGRTAYAASKHALHGFFDTLRTELEEDGVDVMLVCPSFVATGFSERGLDGRGERKSGQRATAGRSLRPEQVAEAVFDGAQKRQRQRLVSPVAHASLWLWRFSPRLYERLMRRSQRSEMG